MLLIVVTGLIVYIYFYWFRPLNYWKNKGVKYEEGIPIFGNMLPIVTKKYSNSEFFLNIYKNYPNDRYMGMLSFRSPTLLVKDPQLIKTIMVKEFDTFPEHRRFLPEDVDPLWSKNIFAMKGGEEWHELRSTLSPTFTSSKMKAMFVLMKDCSKQFSEYFLKQGDFFEVELKDAFARFSTDVVATTVFGVTCDSLTDPKNEFYLMAKDISNFTGLKGLVFLVNLLSPTLAKRLKLPMFSKKAGTFFLNVIKESIRLRKEKGIVQMDILHLLMEAQNDCLKYEESSDVPDAGFATVQESNIGRTQKKRKLQITDETITAQVLGFFFAGFDTISTVMSFVCYELAVNLSIQERLRNEIDETLSNSDGEWTYENIIGMKYLDMVVSETLRKWPPTIVTDRTSVKSFVIEPTQPGESILVLEKGSSIFFPIECIHRDAKYYPNPDKFDPERFNDENKHKIQSYTYLPFGFGPRNCLGSRYALLEMKVAVAEIISKFELVATEKTPITPIAGKSKVTPIPDNGISVAFKRRRN